MQLLAVVGEQLCFWRDHVEASTDIREQDVAWSQVRSQVRHIYFMFHFFLIWEPEGWLEA